MSRDDDGEGIGVDRQERLCRELAIRNGWEVADVCVDNSVSGFSVAIGNRPGWQRVERLVESGEVSYVVAYHPDRLSRRMTDIAPLIDRWARTGIAVETVDGGGWDLTSANGTAFAQMGGVMSEWYSRVIGEKVKRAADQRAEGGRAHGGPRPYGFRYPKAHEPQSPSLIHEPDEGAVIQWAAERVLAGDSLTGIAAEARERGYATANGSHWRGGQLGRTLRHPRLIGQHVYKGEVTGQGDWEPILDRTDWERLCARLDQPNVMRGSKRRPRVAVLAGFVRCGNCEAPMSTGWSASAKNRRRDYRCDKSRTPTACGSCVAGALFVEADVVGQMLATLARTNLATSHVRQSVADSRELVEAIANDETVLDEIMGDLAAGRITRREWEVFRVPVAERIAANRERLAGLETDTDLPGEVWQGVDADGWEALTFDQKRSLIAVTIRTVWIDKGQRGAKWTGDRVRFDWLLSGDWPRDTAGGVHNLHGRGVRS